MMTKFDTIIFDLGGVLIDWNPRYLFKQFFVSHEAMEHFLSEVCTTDWNEMQDAGRSFSEATDILTREFPEYKNEIHMYYQRWIEMLGGPIHDTVQILSNLKDTQQYKMYALTNWSDESFPLALEMYEFLDWFDGILVSGAEKMKKPDPQIFELLIDRFGINREAAIFIDDNKKNIDAANNLGIRSLHFNSPAQCRAELLSLDIHV
jgi:2-haloacid dehalogenase